MKVILDKLIYYGALLVVFLLPAYLLRFKIFGIPTTLLEILIYLVFIIFIFRSVFFGAPWPPAEIFKDKLLFIGLVLFFGGALIASIFSTDQRASFGLFKAYFFDPLIFLIVMIFSFDSNKAINILKSYLFSAFGVSILSFFYFLGGELTYDSRLRGIFNSPNYLAMYLSPAVVISGWFVFYNIFKDYLSAWFYKFILVFLLFVLCLTFSFGAFLGVFLAALAMLIRLNLKRAAALAVIFAALFSAVFFQWRSEKQQSFSQRIYIWEASLDILRNNFLAGVGPGMFQNHYQLYKLMTSDVNIDVGRHYLKKFPSTDTDWSVLYPHNVFLSFFVQNGLVGGIGFLLLIYWLARTVKEIFNSDQKKYAVLFSAFLVYFLIHGMFDTLFWKNDLSVIFFVFIGTVFIIKNLNPQFS